MLRAMGCLPSASARATRTLCQFHSCPRPTPPHLTSSIPSLAPASWEGRVTNHPLPTHPPTNLGTPEGTMMQGRPHKVVRTRRYRARFAFEPKSQRRVGGTLDLNASACWPRLPCVWVISFCVHQCGSVRFDLHLFYSKLTDGGKSM